LNQTFNKIISFKNKNELTNDGLEFWINLPFLYHRKIVSKRTKARLEFLVIKTAGLLLVKMPEEKKIKVKFWNLPLIVSLDLLEHHREFLKRVFADSRLIAGLDLLL
jgi:hypothetical protein